MKRIGIYLRVSTEEQARIQDGSLVSQRNRLLEYIEFQNKRESNWGTQVDIYCDEGKSAKNMSGRPEFLRLLTDVKLGRIDLIIATELSRLSRSLKDFCEVWDLLKNHKASFITLRESFDTTTASGEMMVFNLVNYAQYERMQTSERIAANWLSRSKRGLFNGGTIPLGYDRNPKSKGQLVINKEESEVVQKVFDLFLEKESLRKTQVALIETGIFNKKFTNKHGFEKGGKVFPVDTLNSLLTNKAYIGLREVKHKDGSAEFVRAVWPAIVTEDSFNKVQERLSKNKNRYKPDTWKKYPFPLTELVQCGECGNSLGGKSGTGRVEKHYYYGHPQLKNPLAKDQAHQCQIKNVRAPRLEEIVTRSLRSLLNDPSLIKKWLEIYQAKTTSDLPEVQGQTKKLELEIQTISKRISNLVQRVADLPPEVPADAFYEQIKEMTKRLNELKQAKENHKIKELDLRSKEIDQDGLKANIEFALNNLDKAPKETQRPIFTNLVKFIEIHPTKIKLGIYAPAKEPMKATGTDGNPSPGSKNSISMEKEGNLLPFLGTRVGSRTVGSGARTPGSGTVALPGRQSRSRGRTLVKPSGLAALRRTRHWRLRRKDASSFQVPPGASCFSIFDFRISIFDDEVVGARVTEVGEPFATAEVSLFRSEPVFQAEFEIIVEPKALSPGELRALVKKYGSSTEVGKVVGASEAFVRQNAKK